MFFGTLESYLISVFESIPRRGWTLQEREIMRDIQLHGPVQGKTRYFWKAQEYGISRPIKYIIINTVLASRCALVQTASA